MPTEKKIRTLDPTIVAAQPGYRAGFISTNDNASVTDETNPESLWVGFSPIVAWLIQPSLEDASWGVDVVGATTYAVTTEGIINGGDHYIVAPDGSWSWPDGPDMKNEAEARQHFIKSNGKGRG